MSKRFLVLCLLLTTIFTSFAFSLEAPKHPNPSDMYPTISKPEDGRFSYKKQGAFDDNAQTHKAALKIQQTNSSCSATVVGKKTILTAQHCIKDDDNNLLVNGLPFVIERRIYDGRDNAFIVLAGADFKDIAKFGSYPKVGDDIFYIGNPDSFTLLLRKGYISGIYDNNIFISDIQVWKGDSGSGIFNSDGVLVGVVSALYGRADILMHGTSYKFMLFNRFGFTEQQIKDAGISYECQCDLLN